MAHDTYMTVEYNLDVKNNNIDYYSRERCKAGNDINLTTTEISSWSHGSKITYDHIPSKSVHRSDALVSHPSPGQE